MRAAQIGGAGNLYDSDGVIYARSRPAPSRAPRLNGPPPIRPSMGNYSRPQPRQNAIRFHGLGQAAKGDPELRKLAETAGGGPWAPPAFPLSPAPEGTRDSR